MDKDVESKLEKLCRRYQTVASEMIAMRPTRMISTKQRRRLEYGVFVMVRQLQQDRSAEVASTVRLAYVRGLREVEPKGKLDGEREQEVVTLEAQLDEALRRVESQAMSEFSNSYRRLRAAQSLEEIKTNPHVVQYVRDRGNTPYPLEQRARASVRSIVEMASAAGALAGAVSGSYDTVTDGT